MNKTKKYICIAIAIVAVIVIACVLVNQNKKSAAYELSGTYSTTSGPEKNAIHIAISKDEKEFLIYNQSKDLESGKLEKLGDEASPIVYKLVVKGDKTMAYLVHEKDGVALLNYETEFTPMEKISNTPSVIGHESKIFDKK